MTNRFDNEAAAWDSNQDIININDKIAEYLPTILNTTDKILELGCGTGLLTFRSYNLVKSWHGVDTSGGMITMLNSKIPKFEGADKIVTAEEMYLEKPEQVGGKEYDWAVSAMTFHHIPDMRAMMKCLYGCVKKGLVIVDYQQWDGSRIFHPEHKMEGVERHGLNGEEVEKMCKEAGFEKVSVEVGFTLTLKREEKNVEFPFLVVKATV